MSQSSVKSVSPSTFEPVPDYPGVVTNSELRGLGIGVIEELDILCCIICKRLVTLSLSKAYEHVHNAHNTVNARVYNKNKITGICEAYDVRREMVTDIAHPAEPAVPYRAIPIREGWVCRPCERNADQKYLFSKSNMDAHFRTDHPEILGPSINHVRAALFQTFCTTYRDGANFFEVSEPPENYEQLSQPQETHDVDRYVTHRSSANRIAAALAAEYRSVYHDIPEEITLKECHHTLFETGFLAHVTGKDPVFLSSLVKMCPDNDPLTRMTKSADRAFRKAQQLISNTQLPLRLALKDDGSGGSIEPMTTLQEEARREYSGTLQRWCIFVLRLYRLRDDDIYPVHFSTPQLAACAAIETYCNNKKTNDGKNKKTNDGKNKTNNDDPSGSKLILHLVKCFWAPGSLNAFAHLLQDKMNDVTARFTVLINYSENGTFQSPRNISHNVVQLKNIMRSLLFLERSTYMATRSSQSSQDDPLAILINPISKFLSKRYITPFSHVCSVVAIASKYAATSIHPPNVSWIDLQTVSVNGERISLPLLSAASLKRLEAAEHHLAENVLLNIPPERLGFKVTEDTHLVDNPSRTEPGYSVFSEPKNGLAELAMKLPEVASEVHPGLLETGVYVDRDGNKRVNWNPEHALIWLRDYDKSVEDLAFFTMSVVGQSPRSEEHCNVKLVNTPGRMRGYFFIGPGLVAEVQYYGKASANTTYDRVLAHGLPWRVAFIFLKLFALAHPLACRLVEHFYGPEKRRVQEISVFALSGVTMTASRLSLLIRRFFSQELGVDVGVRTQRHLLTALQKKLVPGANSLWDEIMMIFDSAGGHTSTTACKHYAMDVSEAHILANDTILKYILCSLEMMLHVFRSLLTETEILKIPELRETVTLSIDREASTPLASAPFDQDSLVTALEAAMERTQSRYTDVLITALMRKLHAQGFPSLGGALTMPDAVPNDVLHLETLREYLNSPTATWATTGQSQAFALVLRRSSSVLVNLPTSAGKSFLFGSLPYIESGTTLVMFPLRALMTDQIKASENRQRILEASGRQHDRVVSFSLWSPENTRDGLIAISAEGLGEDHGIQGWFDRMLAKRTLNRVVIDEIHLLATSKFRPVMEKMAYLTKKRVPIIGLSATVAPHVEFAVGNLVGCPTWKILREPTQRPNIEYHIGRYEDEETATKALVRHVQRLLIDLQNGEGFLVICRTIGQVNIVCRTLLRSKPYHGQLDDETAEKNLTKFINGSIPVLVGTTAAGTGVNKPNIRAVFHLCPPRGLPDYMQETGRAGRDGKPAVSIVFDWPNRPGPEDEDFNSPLLGWTTMKKILDEFCCIRYEQSRWLDGGPLALTCTGGVGFRLCCRCLAAQRLFRLRRGRPQLDGPHMPEISKALVVLPAKAFILDQLPTKPPLKTPLGPIDDPNDINEIDVHPAPLESMPNQPSGSPEQESQIQQKLPVRMPVLAVPAPVGSAVIADAEDAEREERESRIKPDNNPYAGGSDRIYNMDNLIKMMDHLRGRCIYCIFNNTPSHRHLLHDCLRLPQRLHGKKNIAHHLAAFSRDGKNCYDLKETIAAGGYIKESNVACFKCLWTNGRVHGHPVERENNETICSAKDMVAQACWLYWTNPDRYQRLQNALPTLAAARISNMQELAAWMCTVADSGTYKKKKYCIYNMQKVVMYLMFVEQKIVL